MEKTNLFSIRYEAIFKTVIQTLILFLILFFPFVFNFVTTSPPYTINNYGPGGYSIFREKLVEEDFNVSRILISTENLLDLPKSSILIIAGGTKSYRNIEIQRITAFLYRGGTVFLLIDSITSQNLALKLNISSSMSNIMETVNYYKSPEIVLTEAPFKEVLKYSPIDKLAFLQPKVVYGSTNTYLKIKTNNTAFLDSNFDKKWSMYKEDLREYTIARVEGRGSGVLIVVGSPSFLTNDLYVAGFANINTTIYLLKLYSSYLFGEGARYVYFDESHKRWSIWSRDGLINQTYGTITLLTQSEAFILMIILLIIGLYYILPNIRKFKRKSKKGYKDFLKKHIYSKERELYDTLGQAVKPTEEEKILTSLYFQYENFPNRVYNIYLQRKLNNVSEKNFTDEEKTLFNEIIKRKIDFKVFIYLFNKLEEIQKRNLV
ncbi:MAG: GldG family protein [Candidatus Heimdallarchaeum endolithica]|uniref:GldG family protein n=1 Tax=Candidatus Heimdallarchaeum endolithica TaxID=2876572 RepID=A0A9Y1FNJ7_9ARCH|nr:MAG: GldG family protein [Candidatus Heimdallarchaeum endolithica]